MAACLRPLHTHRLLKLHEKGLRAGLVSKLGMAEACLDVKADVSK